MQSLKPFELRPTEQVSARYAAGKVPITVLIEDYIHGRLNIEGDFRAFISQRTNVANYRIVGDHLKFMFTNFLPEVTMHTKAQDVRIGREHYDRGNDFFAGFLGPRMIYTSAFFTSPDQTLEQAQDQKMRLVCEKMQLQQGERYLDIGCGWGTLVATAAKNYGVDATGITIAEKGAAFGKERIAEYGVKDKARILTLDYRDIPAGPYNKISCLEMAEHVGVKNFQKFMKQVYGLLADDGIFYLQIAGLRARKGTVGFHIEDMVWGLFMSKYIFPGADASMPLSFVVENMEKAGFEVHSVENIGIHYSLTISRWYDNWMAHKEEITKAYGEWWFRLWQVFLGRSVHIAAQGSSTCFQIVANKNLDNFNRQRWIGGVNLGERDLERGAAKADEPRRLG